MVNKKQDYTLEALERAVYIAQLQGEIKARQKIIIDSERAIKDLQRKILDATCNMPDSSQLNRDNNL